MTFDKDAFLQDHWNEFRLVSKKISNYLRYRFKSVCRSEELHACAVYGVLKAYLYMDMQDTKWNRYLYQYGYHHAHIDVIKMLGWVRRQTPRGANVSNQDTQCVNDDTLIEMYLKAAEAYVSANKHLLPDVMVIDKRSFVQDCLGNSFERQVFEYVIKNAAADAISRELRLSMQTLHIILLRIVLIYCLACENLPYQSLLKPLRDFPE